MKHTNYRSRTVSQWQPAHPNAAEPGYFTGKALEILGACASAMGVISVMMFFLILS